MIDSTSITLRWYRWNRHIDAKYQLEYDVLYRQYGVSKAPWLEAIRLVQSSDSIQEVVVGGLKYNTYYEFQLIPYMNDGVNDIKGMPSPVSLPIRTNCACKCMECNAVAHFQKVILSVTSMLQKWFPGTSLYFDFGFELFCGATCSAWIVAPVLGDRISIHWVQEEERKKGQGKELTIVTCRRNNSSQNKKHRIARSDGHYRLMNLRRGVHNFPCLGQSDWSPGCFGFFFCSTWCTNHWGHHTVCRHVARSSNSKTDC